MSDAHLRFRSPKPEGTETSKGHIFKELNLSIKTVSQQAKASNHSIH